MKKFMASVSALFIFGLSLSAAPARASDGFLDGCGEMGFITAAIARVVHYGHVMKGVYPGNESGKYLWKDQDGNLLDRAGAERVAREAAAQDAALTGRVIGNGIAKNAGIAVAAVVGSEAACAGAQRFYNVHVSSEKAKTVFVTPSLKETQPDANAHPTLVP